MAALQYVNAPGYAAILFRRTYPELAMAGALMDRASEWLGGTAARWNEQSKTWLFPSGATVSFGYLQTERDKFRYQSAEFSFVGFDELTQFEESQYRYLFSRLRRLKTSGIPLRMRAASNPGGSGHEWVKQRFLVEGKAHGRHFVPSMLSENPYLDAKEYAKSLSELDPVTRSQLLNGDWTVRQAGGMFRREWFQIVDQAPVDCRKVRYWDMAATESKEGSDPDWTVGTLVGVKDGVYYICDVKRTRTTPQGVENLIHQTAELDGIEAPVWMEQEPGSSGKSMIDHYRRSVLFGFAFRGDKVTGSKILRAGPASSAAEAGNIKLVRGPYIGELLDELEAFPQGSHDDQADSLSAAIGKLKSGGACTASSIY